MPPDLRRALTTFLLSAFSVDELQRFVRYLEGGEEVLYSVPGRGVAPRTYVEEVVDAMERFGLLADNRLFNALRSERGRRAPEINKLEAAHLAWLSGAGAPVGGGTSAAPGTAGAATAVNPATASPGPGDAAPTQTAAGPVGAGPHTGWDMFLVHASSDKPRVRALDKAIYALDPSLRVFFDERSIDPGDNWAFVIPEALRASRMVVVCLSVTSGGGWYNHSEIAGAVVMARENNIRIVPVYLDGRYKGVPYGLETLVGISVPETGIEGTARKLVDLVGKAPRNLSTRPA